MESLMRSPNLFLIVSLLISFSVSEITTESPALKSPQNLTCEDMDMQRTLTWKSGNILDKTRYEVEYCPLGGPYKYSKLNCYEDERRTKLIQNLTTPFCKTSVDELLFWSYNIFRVFAVSATNEVIRSRYEYAQCGPIVSETKLTRPDLSVQKINPTSIEFTLSLPEKLTLMAQDDLRKLEIQYRYCIVERNIPDQNCSTVNSSSGHCKVDNALTDGREQAFVFSDLKEGNHYCIEAKYSTYFESPVVSDVTRIEVKTTKDPFPPSAQITLILSLCGLVAFVFISIVIARFLRRLWRYERDLKTKKLPPMLEDMRKELYSSEDINEDPTNYAPCQVENFQFQSLEMEEEKIDMIAMTIKDRDSNFVHDSSHPTTKLTSTKWTDEEIYYGPTETPSQASQPVVVQQDIIEVNSKAIFPEIRINNDLNWGKEETSMPNYVMKNHAGTLDENSNDWLLSSIAEDKNNIAVQGSSGNYFVK